MWGIRSSLVIWTDLARPIALLSAAEKKDTTQRKERQNQGGSNQGLPAAGSSRKAQTENQAVSVVLACEQLLSISKELNSLKEWIKTRICDFGPALSSGLTG